jgi:GNAT superfamily N-acetyltransferase
MPAGYTIRPFEPEADKAGLLKLWRDAAGFDASVPMMTQSQLDALLAHPMSEQGAPWRVAAASNNAIVGAMSVRFLGSLRTELSLAVNPAWRGRGIGQGLLAEAPANKRLLITSRGSVSAASELLEKQGFTERFRTVHLRHDAKTFDDSPLPLPSWATIKEDDAREALRYIGAAKAVFGEDEISDARYVAAELQRPGVRVIYLRSPKGDDGIAVIGPSPQVKKGELNPDGSCSVGLLERVALSKAVRGKGVSRPLIRAGLSQLIDDGYAQLEVTADKRRQAALDLYLREGFEVHDEDVHWIRRDDA